MKIHIIGGSGSGKTYISKKISNEYNIKTYDLDNVQWNNNAKTYGVKNTPEVREKLLNNIIKNKKWIIEGVYYKWCDSSFKAADYIFLLNTPLKIQRKRIITRFIKRKLNIEKTGKKETLKSIIDLLKWNKQYNTVDREEILNKLKPYNKKLHIVENYADIEKIIKSKK